MRPPSRHAAWNRRGNRRQAFVILCCATCTHTFPSLGNQPLTPACQPEPSPHCYTAQPVRNARDTTTPIADSHTSSLQVCHQYHRTSQLLSAFCFRTRPRLLSLILPDTSTPSPNTMSMLPESSGLLPYWLLVVGQDIAATGWRLMRPRRSLLFPS